MGSNIHITYSILITLEHAKGYVCNEKENIENISWKLAWTGTLYNRELTSAMLEMQDIN
jgi:hypothetical protein